MDKYDLSLWTALIDIRNLTSDTKAPDFSNDILDISQNSPNPYKDKTAISFKLHSDDYITLTVYDSLGIKITDVISNEFYSRGKHVIILDNTKLNLKPGIYYYSLQNGNYIKTKKMIVSE